MVGDCHPSPAHPSSPRVLVTGASGFIGCQLASVLAGEGFPVRGAVRSREQARVLPTGVEPGVIGNLDEQPDWGAVLKDVQVVVHLAGRAHVMRDAGDALAAYRRTNVRATEALAVASAAHGVKRLILVSSLGVLGRSSQAPLDHLSPPAPEDLYAVSKAEAETVLREVADRAGMQWVILRPPLVYGPGNPGNFLRLLKLVAHGVPLPLGAVHNRRSMVSVFNLGDLVRVCIDHPAAAGETFLVSDGDDLSTPQLIRELGRALGRSVRLLPVPPSLLRLGGRVTGRQRDVERVCDSLTVDIAHTRDCLGWNPPLSAAEGIDRTATWYREAQRVV